MNVTLAIIIAVAIVIFLIVLSFIYRAELRKILKIKLKKVKEIEEKKQEPDKKPTNYTVEDFKPINPINDDSFRDSSLDSLFLDDEYDLNDNSDDITPEFDEQPSFNDNSRADFEEFMNSIRNDSNYDFNENKSLAQKIRELPPEIKVLVVDNLLERKDDKRDN